MLEQKNTRFGVSVFKFSAQNPSSKSCVTGFACLCHILLVFAPRHKFCHPEKIPPSLVAVKASIDLKWAVGAIFYQCNFSASMLVP